MARAHVQKHQGGGALVPLSQAWEDKLAALAQADEAVATDVGGIPWLSLRGGSFHIGDTALESPLPVILLGAVRENLYYRGKYDPNKAQSPDCYALSAKVAKMEPGADAPAKQHKDCAGCAKNAFGSAENGRGKACSNKVRLIAIAQEEGLTPERISRVRAVRLRVPTTSLVGFSEYVQSITQGKHRPLFSVTTRMTLEDDERSQFKLLFEFDELIRNETMLEALEARAKALQPALWQSPVFVPSEDGGKTVKGKRVVAVKKAAKRRRF